MNNRSFILLTTHQISFLVPGFQFLFLRYTKISAKMNLREAVFKGGRGRYSTASRESSTRKKTSTLQHWRSHCPGLQKQPGQKPTRLRKKSRIHICCSHANYISPGYLSLQFTQMSLTYLLHLIVILGSINS